MPHKHTFDSDELHIPSTLATTTVLACKCGAIASFGMEEPYIIWEPWRDDEVRQRTAKVA